MTAVLRTLVAFAAAGVLSAAHADVADAPRLTGDIGLGADMVQDSAPGGRAKTRALPYVYADYGRLFVREDTLGTRIAPVGWGWLELAARISSDGADGDGPRLPHRADPRPLGVGTFQDLPWGGVFLNAFADLVSGVTLLEASYAGQCAFGPVTVYPSVGAVHRSARYVDHLYGVSDDEAAATGLRAYAPRASTVPVLGLSAEWTLGRDWAIVGHVQREAFDAAITDSPRVDRSSRTTVLLALARRFD